MKILIADDSQDKIQDLRMFFDEHDKESEISICMSFKATIKNLLNNHYDLVMLDMTMPSMTNSLTGKATKTRTLAGKDVLTTLNYHNIIGLKCIVFSQFNEFGRHGDVVSLGDIYNDIESDYSHFLLGYVQYNSSSEKWKDDILRILEAEKLLC